MKKVSIYKPGDKVVYIPDPIGVQIKDGMLTVERIKVNKSKVKITTTLPFYIEEDVSEQPVMEPPQGRKFRT